VSAAAAFILKSVSIIRGVRWRVGWTVTGPDLLEPLALVAACCRTADAAAKASILWAYLHEPFVLYGTLWILLVAYVTHYLPYGVRTITGSFHQVSPDLERAASACRASRLAAFRDIVFPLVRPGILAGWMLMFVSMIRELSSSIFLFVPGTETTAVTMLEMWQEARFSGVAVLALTLITISIVVLVRRLAGAAYLSGER